MLRPMYSFLLLLRESEITVDLTCASFVSHSLLGEDSRRPQWMLRPMHSFPLLLRESEITVDLTCASFGPENLTLEVPDFRCFVF